ncbi:MAG: ABC transporter permease [bacterium]
MKHWQERQEYEMSNEVLQASESTDLVASRVGAQSRLISIARSIIRGLTALVCVCLVWEAIRRGFHFSSITMPSAWSIWQKFFSRDSQGELFYIFLAKNILVTGRGAVFGLLLGAISGVTIGVLISTNRLFRRALLPLVISAQTVPIVAIAPAVVLFFGTGTLSKTVVAGFLTFFPAAVTTARGIQSVPVDSVNLMRTYNASWWTVLTTVKIPFALPLIFVGLETSAAFSVVGAIVAELPFGSKNGLGVVILASWQFYTIAPQSLYCTVIGTCLLGALIVAAIRIAARFSVGSRQHEF